MEITDDRPLTLEEAIETMLEGEGQTILIPCFLVTPRKKFVAGVLQKCRQALRKPGFTRIYILFQQGISEKKGRGIWNEICRRGKKMPNAHMTDRLAVYSFGNVPNDILFRMMDMAGREEYIDPPDNETNE